MAPAKNKRKMTLYIVRCIKANEVSKDSEGKWAYEYDNDYAGRSWAFTDDISEAQVYTDPECNRMLGRVIEWVGFKFEIIELQPVSVRQFKTSSR